ncbi:MAG: DoxX family protein [Muribaculaceae bacterium]
MLLKMAQRVFVYLSTHTYSNLSRLFLRLFVGVMILQMGINQMSQFDKMCTVNGVMGMDGCTTMAVLVVIELVCSVLIVLGLLTRIAIIPLLVVMCVAVNMLLVDGVATNVGMFGMMPEMMPVLFCGVLVFFGISGPGKISLDYILARYIVSISAASEEEEKTLDEA